MNVARGELPHQLEQLLLATIYFNGNDVIDDHIDPITSKNFHVVG